MPLARVLESIPFNTFHHYRDLYNHGCFSFNFNFGQKARKQIDSGRRQMRYLLLTRLPEKLADIILDHAQHWPKASCAFNADGKEDLCIYGKGSSGSAASI